VRRDALATALLLLAVTFAVAVPSEPAGPGPQPSVYLPAIASAVGNVSSARLYTEVYNLQNFSTRYAFSTNITLAYQYIFDQFAANPGLQVAFQDFTYQGTAMKNILAVLPGTDPKNTSIYVIGGHMDSTTNPPPANDPMVWAPGADDDGSGTAAVIEAARVLSRHRFSATILFAAFGSEEQGLIGSNFCATCLAGTSQDVRLMINLDMIGHDPTNASGLEVITNVQSEWAADLALQQVADYGIGLAATKVVDPAVTNSDHGAFWSQGFPAIFLTEADFNPNWHKPTDTIDRLNFNLVTNTTKTAVATLAAAAGILDTSQASLFFDLGAYGVTGVAGLTLYDTDLNTNPGLVESSSAIVVSPQEPGGEIVSLLETGPDTGQFTGSLPLGAGAGVSGELQVAAGATITATYADLVPLGPRTAVAVIDGFAPTIRNVAVVPGITGALVTWETSEPTDANVSFGTTPGLGLFREDPRFLTRHRIELSGLAPDTTYHFTATSRDTAGQAVTGDNGGSPFTFHTLTGITGTSPYGRVGYVRSGIDPNPNFLSAARLVVGYSSVTGRTYRGAAQFDTVPTAIPGGATVTDAWVDVLEDGFVYTGAGLWDFRVLNGSIDAGWTGHNYTTITNAASDFGLPPTLANADMRPGAWRRLDFPPARFDYVKARVNTGSLSLRIDGPAGPVGSIYQWHTGYPFGCPELALSNPRLQVTYSATGDTTGPVATLVGAAPNPTFGVPRTLITATLSDAATGGSEIANAEFFLSPDPGIGLASPMWALDGGFDTATEEARLSLDVAGLPNGVYQGNVRGRDRAGNWGPVSSFLVYVGPFDLAYPRLLVSDSPDPAPQGATVTITANVTDDVLVAEVWLNVTDPFGATAFNVTMPKVGADYVHATPYIGAGLWNYIVWARDSSAKWNWSQGTFLVTDLVPPAITNVLAAPDPGEHPASVNLTATITDLSGVAGARVNVTRPDGQFLLNFTMLRNGDGFSYERTYTTLGTYTFVIAAMDIYGNWATASGSFTVADTTAPSILNAAAAPDPAEVYEVVNITAEVGDPFLSNLSLRLTAPGGAFFDTGMGWDAGSGQYYFPAWYDVLGTHSFLITATDSSGNNATSGGSFLVRDTTPPTVLAAADPPEQANGGIITILADARDNLGIATVTAFVMDPLGGSSTSPMAYNATSGLWEVDTTAYTLGTFTYRIDVLDLAGRVANATGTFASVDRVFPDLGELFLEPPLAELGLDTYIGVTASDDVGVVLVTFDVVDGGGAPVGNFTATYNPASGRWEYTQAFATGDYTFTIYASDAAGNLVYAPSSFRVGSGAPPVADAGADQDSEVGAAILLSGSGSTDDVGIARWEWSITGPQPFTADTEDFTIVPTRAGTYTATLRVWDAAGRSSTDSATLTVVDPTTGGGPGVDWWWIILLLILVLVVVLIIVYVVWKRRREKAAQEEARQAQAQQAQAEPPAPPPSIYDDIPPPPPD